MRGWRTVTPRAVVEISTDIKLSQGTNSKLTKISGIDSFGYSQILNYYLIPNLIVHSKNLFRCWKFILMSTYVDRYFQYSSKFESIWWMGGVQCDLSVWKCLCNCLWMLQTIFATTIQEELLWNRDFDFRATMLELMGWRSSCFWISASILERRTVSDELPSKNWDSIEFFLLSNQTYSNHFQKCHTQINGKENSYHTDNFNESMAIHTQTHTHRHKLIEMIVTDITIYCLLEQTIFYIF